MSANRQLLDMLDTIDETENYLRKRCAAGTAAQSILLFEDLSSLIDMIHQRFRDKGVLPVRSPQFRTYDGSQTAEMFLDEVARWKNKVRERIQQKEVLKELSRGSLLDALDKEGKPFVETAKALRAMKPKAPPAQEAPLPEEVSPQPAAKMAGEEMARKAFTDALAKSPAAAALREEGNGSILNAIRSSRSMPSQPLPTVKETDLPEISQIKEDDIVPTERIGGRTIIRPIDADEDEPIRSVPPKIAPPPAEPAVTPQQRRTEQLNKLRASAKNELEEIPPAEAKTKAEPEAPRRAARPMSAAPEPPKNSRARPMGAPSQEELTSPAPKAQERREIASTPMTPKENTPPDRPDKPKARPMSAASSQKSSEKEKETPIPLKQIQQGNYRIHNEVDMRMFHLLDELSDQSVNDVIFHMKKLFPALESRYKMVITDYMRRFSYWGSLNVEKNDYALFNGRAAQLVEHVDDLRWLYTVLEDYRSKKTLLAILENWYSFNFKDLSGVKDKTFESYFDLDILKCDENEHYVDVGAYIGESVETFIKTYGQYEHISCYEITEQSFVSLQDNTSDYERISLYQLGAWDKNGEMYIGAKGSDPSTNCLSESGSATIETVALDNHLTIPPTFIKINAEGGEDAVLQGCTNLIRRHHPKIVVRADHSNESIWKLAKLINSMDARYRFYMRHYGGNLVPSEYVLIAI